MTTTETETKSGKKNVAKDINKMLAVQIDGLKSKLDKASEFAKDNIRITIDSCTKQYNQAIEANKKYMEELREQMKDSQMDTSTLDEISSTFTSSLQMSDEVIDAIIDAHLRRVSQIVDFNKKCVGALSESYTSDEEFKYEKFVALLQKNFEQSAELSTREMKKIVDVYNKHINLSLNFNKRFSKNINSQVDAMIKFQSKGLQAYSSLIANWWEKEK